VYFTTLMIFRSSSVTYFITKPIILIILGVLAIMEPNSGTYIMKQIVTIVFKWSIIILTLIIVILLSILLISYSKIPNLICSETCKLRINPTRPNAKIFIPNNDKKYKGYVDNKSWMKHEKIKK
jgi:predicted membrane protein